MLYVPVFEMWEEFVTGYFISKFPTMFEYWEKNLERFFLSLRKGVMCYEYIIDSWNKCNETLLPSKEKIFSKLEIKE